MMLCQNCSKAQATTHIKRIINGETTEQHLCAACARRLGLDGFFDDFSLSIPNIFAGFFGDAAPLLTGRQSERCASCGSSFEEIVRTGMVGCADCYKTFYDRLLPSIQRIHGRARHAGKRPLQTVPAAQAEDVPPQEPTKEEKIAALEQQMQQAVESQNFEQAAVLRDNIKALREEQ
jgi:protein arginine kinase activator